MKKFLHDLFTEADNQTFCIVKILMSCGALSFIMISAAHMWQNKQFDFQAFGIGFGTLMGGSGVAGKLKTDTPL